MPTAAERASRLRQTLRARLADYQQRLDDLLGPVAFGAGVRIVRIDEDVCVEEDPALHVRPS